MNHLEHDASDSARAAQSIHAVPTAQADPSGNFLSFAPETLTVGTGAAAAGGANDLVFGGLGHSSSPYDDGCVAGASVLETFLSHLAREAGESLPPAKAESLVAEAREHLDDSIRARLELGKNLEQAEREAIASFGSIASIRKRIVSAEPLVNGKFLPIAITILGYFVVFRGGRSLPGWAKPPVLGTVLVLHGASWLRSAQLRWPLLFALALVFLPPLGGACDPEGAGRRRIRPG